jgi:hypothetical protein
MVLVPYYTVYLLEKRMSGDIQRLSVGTLSLHGHKTK